MKVKKIIHKGWDEWENMIPMYLKQKSMFGEEGWAEKYQYIYESKKGIISLARLKVGGFDNLFWIWEIFELSENNLFDNVERFHTRKDAIIRIKELLNGEKEKR